MKKEAVLTYPDSKKLEVVVWRDPESGHQVFYKCTEMNADDIEQFINGICKIGG